MERKQSFDSISRWYDEARENGNDSMSFLLVANKCDLEEE